MKAARVFLVISGLVVLIVASLSLGVYLCHYYLSPFAGTPIREGPSLAQIAQVLATGMSEDEVKSEHGPPSTTGHWENRAGETVHVIMYSDIRSPGSRLSLIFERGSLVNWRLSTEYSHIQDNLGLPLTRSLNQLEQGMETGEVAALLGNPASVSISTLFPAREQKTHWTYYSTEYPDNRLWLVFDNGKLADVSVKEGGQL